MESDNNRPIEVKGIAEANSMQPYRYSVGDFYSHKELVKIHSIKLEKINFPINGDPFEYMYYVGRDIDGNKLFAFKAETVNMFL